MENKNNFELSESEYIEREKLIELQNNNNRWFSQYDFERLQALSEKMFKNKTK